MKERPILFKPEMVKAILDGRKTMTRRVIKNDYMIRESDPYPFYYRRNDALWDSFKTLDELVSRHCPYGKPCDILWVRETWAGVDWLAFDCDKDPPETIGYRADKSARYMGKSLDTTHWNWNKVKWRPSIFMPKWACRLWLEVTEIRVERVQDITPEDVTAEGLERDLYGSFKVNGRYFHTSGYAFAALWDSINEKRGYGWDEDPWVWVVEFRILKAE